MTGFLTHRRMIIVTGAFRLSRLLAIGYWQESQKLKANSQQQFYYKQKHQITN